MVSTRPTPAEIARLDPYAFLAVLGKRVIDPGGRRATQELLGFADFAAGRRVPDIGCGVANTASHVGSHYGAQVTAADISALMLGRASLQDRVTVEQAATSSPSCTRTPPSTGSWPRQP